MDETEGEKRELPMASLAGGSLSYSREITSDMPWVLRFVGCFILYQGVMPLLQFLPDIGQLARGVMRWQDSLGLLGIALVAIAGLGILARKRPAFWLAIGLCLAQDLVYVFSMPWSTAASVWLRQLPGAAVKLVLLWQIWRRAERSGMVVPARAGDGLSPAPGDDVLWLIRRLGVYLLLPAVTLALWVCLNPQGLLVEFPASWVASIGTASLSLAVGIGLILGQYRLLMFWVCIALVAPLASGLALQWDFAHDPRYRGAMPAGPMLTAMIRAVIIGAVAAGFYFVLYRKARGRG